MPFEKILTEMHNRPPTEWEVLKFVSEILTCAYCKDTKTHTILKGKKFDKELKTFLGNPEYSHFHKYISDSTKFYIFECKGCKSLKILLYKPGQKFAVKANIDRSSFVQKIKLFRKKPPLVVVQKTDENLK